MIHETAFVHPKAHVENARIGARTRVWQFSSIIRGAEIGADCNIASGVCIDGSVIGNGCVIAHNLAMGPGFLLGDRVFVAPNVTFCNDAWPSVSKDGWDAAAFNGDNWAVIVEDDAVIGANAVILPGVRIGRGAMVAAGSVVTKDVPAKHLVVGTTCNPITPRLRERMRFARSLAR